MVWYDLESHPPSEKEYAVILFPCKTDCCLLYTISNPVYARKHGLSQGYTHWAKLELAPGHYKWEDWQNDLRKT